MGGANAQSSVSELKDHHGVFSFGLDVDDVFVEAAVQCDSVDGVASAFFFPHNDSVAILYIGDATRLVAG